MDVVFEHEQTPDPAGSIRLRLRELPSTYFRQQCFISCDAEERAAGRIIDLVGAHNFIWASDYPHGDHPSTYATNVVGLVDGLTPADRAKVIGGNVVDIYGLEPIA
jgi:hypothetical protein